jgi:predicted permease
MDRIRTLLSRVAALFGKRKRDDDLDEELRAHIELAVEENIKTGMTPQQARTAALRALGGVTQTREDYRMQRGLPFFEQMARDVRFAFRQMLKSPGFTLIAVLTLALGVGANTAVFSLINGLLLRPLPVPHAEQLAVLRYWDGGQDQDTYFFSAPFFRGLENRHDVFSATFAYNSDTLLVRGQSGNETIPGVLVSGQYFQALETPPLLGRYLTPQDDQPGGSPAGLAVVISERFWNSWFNRAPDVVGRKMVIANTPFTVVGVMPKRFFGADPTQRPEIFAPLSADPIIDAPRNHIADGIHSWWLIVGARLNPGVGLDQANAQLLTISNPILHEAAAGDAGFIAEKEKVHFRFLAEPGSRGYTYARFLFRKPLVAMFAMCGGVLLLACLNLASLLMARGVARTRELATRLALGASRARLVRQLLTESLLIAVLGTAAGMAAAPLVSHSLVAMVSNGWNDVLLDTSIDLSVFGFAALVAVLSTVLIGLVPALQATAGNLNDHIKEGQHGRQAKEQRRILPRVLMAAEVAVAMTLVVGSALLATSLVRLYKSGPGFDPKGLVNIAFSMDKQQLDGDALMRLYRQLGEGLSQQPGVKSVSFEFIVPLSGRGWNGYYSTAAGGTHPLLMNAVGPAYFETMRIPLYLGREFTWNDTRDSGLKLILNQSAARQLFPGQDALGQQVTYPREKLSYEVVGVVADAKYRGMLASAPAAAYVPMQQDEQPKPSLSAVVRIQGPQGPLAAAARTMTARLAPAIPAPVMTTMDDMLDKSISAERMMALLAVFFAGCALLVTGIGLYGTLAYATARRTSEIGIRMALGARRAGVVAMVFRENVFIGAAGAGVGLAAALLASRALASFLYETSPRDPWVLVGSVAALTLIASAASILPAMRAARIDPMKALRTE